MQIFSGCVCHLEQLHAQSPFLFPIVFSINLIPFFDINFCSVLAVLSPGLFGFVLLYLGRCAVATVAVFCCGFGRWFWCFTAGCHVKSPLFPGSPNPLSNRRVLEKAYKTVDFSQSNALREYSGFHFFYAKLWTVVYEKPMVKKVWKNMKNHVMVCPPPQNQNEVAKPLGSWQYPPPPFSEDFGGHFHIMCAQLRPVGTTTSLGSVRRLPTRSAAPVSLHRPPLSPSARWTQCDDHPLRDHVRERCGQGERRRLMHLTRSGLAPGWPPWWNRLRNVIFSFSDHFCLIFSWKGRYPRPYSFFS